MNANLKQARSFAVATVITFALAFVLGFIGEKLGVAKSSPRVQMFPPSSWPMIAAAFVGLLLALVTVCLSIAGLFEVVANPCKNMAEPGTASNGGPNASGENARVMEGPPSVT